MTLEKHFKLNLAGPPERLGEPERVFADRPPFAALRREGELLEGELSAEVPLMGEIRFPFRSRMDQYGGGRATLRPLPLEPTPAYWAELSGEAQAGGGSIAYALTVRVHARLPEGEKWGGKALRRMAEAAFERTVERTLAQLK